MLAYPDALEKNISRDPAGKTLRLVTVDELNQPWVKDVCRHFREGGDVSFTAKTGNGRYIVNISSIDSSLGLALKIFTIIPEKDILRDVHRIIKVSILISLGIFAVAIFAVVLLSGRVTRPIITIAASTEKIKDFELENVHSVASSIREINAMNDALMKAVAGLQSFKKYVPADLVCELIKSGQEVDIGGETRNLSIFFSDIIIGEATYRAVSEYFPSARCRCGEGQEQDRQNL